MKIQVVMNYELCTELEVTAEPTKAELDAIVNSIDLPDVPGLQWTYTVIFDEEGNELADY